MSASLLFAATFAVLLCVSPFLPGDRRTDSYRLNGVGVDDYSALYLGTNGTLPHLKKADVIFLGTSRLQYVMTKDLLAPYFEARGLRYYSLGFGWREPMRLPLLILEKFELRPRYLIVDVPGFFRDELSEYAKYIFTLDRIDRTKTRIEEELALRGEKVLASVLPLRFEMAPKFRRPISRSRSDGTWSIPNAGARPAVPFSPDSAREPSSLPEQIETAREFLARMKSVGVKVIFIHIPGPLISLASSRRLAQAVGMEVYSPDTAPFTSSDSEHLHPESGQRFAKALLEEISAEF